ncbi:NADH-quinone oxidoreductase subunit J family protein [Sulfobacillus thermosulfidooxidans]|uniref:NADH-quinone oxidoreductase subunit J family protein n=1 Tax=Sulfobacillus thermosulfidooxidans TaxID=28034 RepID=UPI0006B48ACC|nr:NADH-quinone oxidoreductase subunit J [Sulfobacillus thermosulfidooxidans]
MVGIGILAILAIAASIGVVTARQPVHSALYLVGNILSLALLYLILKAEFLAAAQVIVYAGAIMVLFLFVVTLLTAGKEERELPEDLPGQRLTAGVLSIVVGVILVALAIKYPGSAIHAPLPAHFGDLTGIGRLLWGPDFLFLIAVAIMLVSAALGVLVLNPPRRRRAQMEASQAKEQSKNLSNKKEQEGTGS